jgi:hypothetical protein
MEPMTRTEFLTHLDPADVSVTGVYPKGARLLFKTLDTQAGLRIRSVAERYKRHGVKVTSGEASTGHYFVRVTGLVDDTL